MADCYVQTGYWDDGYTDQDICDIAPAARKGDDGGFRSAGKREQFWKARAEEWLGDRLEEAREAVQTETKAKFAEIVAPKVTVALMQWPEFKPMIDHITKLADAMRVQEPDPQIWLQIAEIEQQRRIFRRRRDEEALFILMGWS